MPGKLKIADFSNGSTIDIKNVPKVQYSSQGGLSEVVLDPDFSSNRTFISAIQRGMLMENQLCI